MYSFHTARVGRRIPLRKGFKGRKDCAPCARLPAAFRGVHTTARAPGAEPEPHAANPEAKNKGDALACASAGAAPALPPAPPRASRARPSPAALPPSAARNGGRATKWQPGQVASGRRLRQKGRREPLPPPQPCQPQLPFDSCRGRPFPTAMFRPPRTARRLPLQSTINGAFVRVLPLLFQSPPSPGSAYVKG